MTRELACRIRPRSVVRDRVQTALSQSVFGKTTPIKQEPRPACIDAR